MPSDHPMLHLSLGDLFAPTVEATGATQFAPAEHCYELRELCQAYSRMSAMKAAADAEVGRSLVDVDTWARLAHRRYWLAAMRQGWISPAIMLQALADLRSHYLQLLVRRRLAQGSRRAVEWLRIVDDALKAGLHRGQEARGSEAAHEVVWQWALDTAGPLLPEDEAFKASTAAIGKEADRRAGRRDPQVRDAAPGALFELLREEVGPLGPLDRYQAVDILREEIPPARTGKAGRPRKRGKRIADELRPDRARRIAKRLAREVSKPAADTPGSVLASLDESIDRRTAGASAHRTLPQLEEVLRAAGLTPREQEAYLERHKHGRPVKAISRRLRSRKGKLGISVAQTKRVIAEAEDKIARYRKTLKDFGESTSHFPD